MDRFYKMGGYLMNQLWFKNHLFWRSLLYIDKYNATKKDLREYPVRPQILLFSFSCDIRINIQVAYE